MIKRPIQVSDESQEGTNKCAMHRLGEDSTSIPMVRVKGCLPEWPQTTSFPPVYGCVLHQVKFQNWVSFQGETSVFSPN